MPAGMQPWRCGCILVSPHIQSNQFPIQPLRSHILNVPLWQALTARFLASLNAHVASAMDAIRGRIVSHNAPAAAGSASSVAQPWPATPISTVVHLLQSNLKLIQLQGTSLAPQATSPHPTSTFPISPPSYTSSQPALRCLLRHRPSHLARVAGGACPLGWECRHRRGWRASSVRLAVSSRAVRARFRARHAQAASTRTRHL